VLTVKTILLGPYGSAVKFFFQLSLLNRKCTNCSPVALLSRKATKELAFCTLLYFYVTKLQKDRYVKFEDRASPP
jgi:hypothetical protein